MKLGLAGESRTGWDLEGAKQFVALVASGSGLYIQNFLPALLLAL
jgi:hypothetical protein